ncbi:MAG: LysE family translocator [bacterium]|nr:LysE family translocator [bacterium]
MTTELLIIFSIFSFFYIISPGPAIFLAISNGMAASLMSVFWSTAGNITGLFILSCISISGLGAVLTSSASLFLIIKLIGALYLIFLGISHFHNAKIADSSLTHITTIKPRSSFSFYKEGFLLSLTNPKAVLFFMALFPQFITVDQPLMPQFFILTAIFMSLSFSSLFSYGFIGKSARGLFGNQQAMTWFHRVTGGLFVAMGIGLLQLKNAQS